MSDNNRIGEACWYKPVYATDAWRGGRLRAWATDYEEFDSGPGPFPVGVIEDDEHQTCHSIGVERICFGTQPPS